MTDPVVQALAVTSTQAPARAPDYWTLQKINRFINEDFRLPSGEALRDCEWFSHFKKQELKKLGAEGILLDVGTENAEPGKPNHRVVVVGDWVLDNRHKNPYKRSAFKRMGYTEYPENPGTPR